MFQQTPFRPPAVARNRLFSVRRSSVLKRVERAIVTAVKTKRSNDGLDPVDPAQIDMAAKDVDVDDVSLLDIGPIALCSGMALL